MKNPHHINKEINKLKHTSYIWKKGYWRYIDLSCVAESFNAKSIWNVHDYCPNCESNNVVIWNKVVFNICLIIKMREVSSTLMQILNARHFWGYFGFC